MSQEDGIDATMSQEDGINATTSQEDGINATTSQENGMNATTSQEDGINVTSQPTTQHLQLIRLTFFYNPPNDNNFYHITCERIQENSLDDHSYDHAFFYSCLTDMAVNFHVKCNSLSYSRIVGLLNREIYEIELYTNDSPRNESSLTLHQKVNLEMNLRQKLNLYFLQCHILENYGLLPVFNDGQN